MIRVTVYAERTFNVLNALDEATSGAFLGQFLDTQVQPYFAKEIVNRFAVEGDQKSGDWLPLTEGTQQIREQLGYPPEGPINERTQGLLKAVTENYDLTPYMTGAVIEIPGTLTGEDAKKLETAQSGRDPNPIPYFSPTPPRPVLATGADDLEAILLLLREEIIAFVATRASI